MQEKKVSLWQTCEPCKDEEDCFKETSPSQLKNKWDVSEAVWPLAPGFLPVFM